MNSYCNALNHYAAIRTTGCYQIGLYNKAVLPSAHQPFSLFKIRFLVVIVFLKVSMKHSIEVF